MNSKAALCKALLAGEIVSIMTGFKNFSITNVPREIGRSVERPFGVIVSRLRKEGKTKYGVPCCWYEYRLNPLIENNSEGIKKMAAYVKEQEGNVNIRTGEQSKQNAAINNTLRASGNPIYKEQTFNFA